MKIIRKCIDFFKRETVLCVAALLALASAFVIRPGKDYFGYMDWKTLVLLFCLMAVVSGLQKGGAFDALAKLLLGKMKNTRQLVALLVFLCFFTSMFITNDVALLTFVPFSMLILTKAGQKELLLYTVVMQTIAANLGSLLLPVGNPQNLYLYGRSGMGFLEFVLCMLPLWLVSLGVIVLCLLPVKKREIRWQEEEKEKVEKAGFYGVLFLLCLGTVIGWLSYYVLVVLVVAAILFVDASVLKQVDYMLLLTFVSFFIFIGNVKNMPAIAEWLSHMIQGREVIVSILASQVISNVPAAILLSGFTDEIPALLWGTDIGGLGTLVASLASLISYKLYSRQEKEKRARYLVIFTCMNLVFLVVLILFEKWVH